MIMHSYGGLVGCEALKELDHEDEGAGLKEGGEGEMAAAVDKGTPRKGRVLRLGFIAGLVFPVGRSTLSPKFPPDAKIKGFTCEVCLSFAGCHIHKDYQERTMGD